MDWIDLGLKIGGIGLMISGTIILISLLCAMF